MSFLCLQVLTQLEENLKAEQRAVAEQEYVTFKHLLTPLQVSPLTLSLPLVPGRNQGRSRMRRDADSF